MSTELTRTIQLNGKRGGFAIVSQEDYDLVSKYKWHCSPGGYAQGTVEGKNVYMHRFIMNPPDDKVVDHQNRNRLDNQRTNLKISTTQENSLNKTISKFKLSSNFRGVFFNTDRKKYFACIMHGGVRHHIGIFDSALEAAKNFDLYIVHNKLDMVELNFPENKNEYINTKYEPKIKTKLVQYEGVHKNRNRYVTTVTSGGKIVFTFRSDNPSECALRYDMYIVEKNIPSKRLNFPEKFPNYNPTSVIKTKCEDIDVNTVKLLISDDVTKIVTIDKNDYDKIKFYPCHINGHGYVEMNIKNKAVMLHRYLMGVTESKDYIDHKNNNKLDNTKINLEISDAKKNAQNRSKMEGASSKLHGVSQCSKTNIYRSAIKKGGKDIFSKSSKDENLVARSRDLYIIKNLKGTGYKLNFKWTKRDITKWTKILKNPPKKTRKNSATNTNNINETIKPI